jgi:hypothetical protein
MEPAEAIVNAWLQMKGYFTMNNIRVANGRPGAKPEIDILAVKLNSSGKGIEDRMHVEVTVSVNQFGTWGERGTEELLQNKFMNKDRVACIKNFFGADYKKLLVLGDVSYDEVSEFVKAKGIECYKFSQVIYELKESMAGKSYGDDTRRLLGLVFKHDK